MEEKKVRRKSIIRNLIEEMEIGKKQKMSPLFIILSIFSVCALIISNIVAVKSVPLFDWKIDGAAISIAASFVVFPFTYIISDIFSEVYGYGWSRKISWIGFIFNLFFIGIFELVIIMPAVDQVLSDEFADILGASPMILAASVTAFMAGDFFNDIVYEAFRKKYAFSTKAFLFRSLFSSLCGEIVDSLVFLPLLYVAIGGYGTIITSFKQLIVIVLIQAVLKTLVEVVLSPLVLFIVKRVKKYEENVSEIQK